MASNPRDRASKELVKFVTERVNAGAEYSWGYWHQLTKEKGFTESYVVVKAVAFHAIHQIALKFCEQRLKQREIDREARRLERLWDSQMRDQPIDQ